MEAAATSTNDPRRRSWASGRSHSLVSTSSCSSSSASTLKSVRVIARIRPMQPGEHHAVCRPARPENVPTATSPSQRPSALSPILADATPLVTNKRRQPPSVSSSNRSMGTVGTKSPFSKSPKQQLQQSQSESTTDRLPTRLLVDTHNSTRPFDFDAVLGGTATQQAVYAAATTDGTQIHMVRSAVLEGTNVTVLAYGQTGSGKTYTMGGWSNSNNSPATPTGNDTRSPSPRKLPHLRSGSSSGKRRSTGSLSASSMTSPPVVNNSPHLQPEDGVLMRAVYDLFQAKPDDAVVTMTCLEIFNDELRDLLDEDTVLSLAQDTVQGLHTVELDSFAQVRAALAPALCKRTTGKTRLNARSSRSHAITTFTVKHHASHPLTATLTLVDLAGSERIHKTGVVGDQERESIHINQDLFVLGKVVSALADGKMRHISYRDCKLTRLLQTALGGNCCTVLIACVSPTAIHADESLNTLRYAERARAIVQRVRPNLALPGLEDLRAENEALRNQVARLQQQQRDDIDDDDLSTSSSHLSVRLTAKLQKASRAAQQARHSSASVAATVDRWRSRLGKMRNQRDGDDDASIARELSFGSFEDDASTLSLSSMLEEEQQVPGRPELQKTALLEELARLTNQVEAQKAKLEVGKRALEEQQDAANQQVYQQERLRNELRTEVAQLKLKVRLLATDVNKHGAASARSLLFGAASLSRSNSMEQAPQDGGDVELATRSNSSNVELQSQSMRQQQQEQRDEWNKRAAADQARMASLERQVETLTQEQAAQAKRDQAHIASLERQVESLTEEKQDLEDQAEHLMETQKSLEDDLLVAQGTLLGLQAQFEVLHQEHQVQSANLELHAEELQLRTETQDRIQALTEHLESIQAESDRLRKQNEGLQQELERALAAFEDEANSKDADEEQPNRGDDGGTPKSHHQQQVEPADEIRSHAEKMLSWADKALEKKPGRSSSSLISGVSSLGTELRPSPAHRNATTNSFAGGRPPVFPKEAVVISNIETMAQTACQCESSMFSGNAEHVVFYLPKLGIHCSCGKRKDMADMMEGSDPCALVNILRDWQVDFLSSLGIHDAVAFVHAHSQRAAVLAKDMRSWRRAHKLASIKTKSCSVALHIWAKTCKAVLHAVREQRAQGVTAQRPAFLDVHLDNRTVSTLGLGSVQEGP